MCQKQRISNGVWNISILICLVWLIFILNSTLKNERIKKIWVLNQTPNKIQTVSSFKFISVQNQTMETILLTLNWIELTFEIVLKANNQIKYRYQQYKYLVLTQSRYILQLSNLGDSKNVWFKKISNYSRTWAGSRDG